MSAQSSHRVRNNNHKLSVIIPVYNEPKIVKNLKIIEQELKKTGLEYEIICVDDGSNDGTTRKLIKNHSKKIKSFSYPLNVGKGFAFCFGFTQSTGDLVGFIDSDLDIHPRQISLLVDLMDLVNADIVIGSKRHPLSKVSYTRIRRFLSRTYQLFVKLSFGLNITDSQVGLKLFKRKVLEEVIPRLAIKTWAFDLEILVVAHHLGFRRIIEAPVEMKIKFSGSRMMTKTAIKNIIQETLAIFYRKNILHFYDRELSRNNHQWFSPAKTSRTKKISAEKREAKHLPSTLHPVLSTSRQVSQHP